MLHLEKRWLFFCYVPVCQGSWDGRSIMPVVVTVLYSPSPDIPLLFYIAERSTYDSSCLWIYGWHFCPKSRTFSASSRWTAAAVSAGGNLCCQRNVGKGTSPSLCRPLSTRPRPGIMVCVDLAVLASLRTIKRCTIVKKAQEANWK